MKVIMELKDGSLYTENGVYICVVPETTPIKEYTEPTIPVLETTAIQLAAIGYTSDDIVKLKVAGIL